VEHGGPVEGAGAAPARPPERRADGWPARLLDALADLSVKALLGLWLALVGGCGVAYWLLGAAPGHGLLQGQDAVGLTSGGLGTAVYFSFVTATSVGFGDVAPVGAARPLAVVESVAALLLFGCLISKLVSRRQERLIEEIHLLTFEDRLGRVRTNLHMVLSELLALGAECDRPGLPREQALRRVESVGMVFLGELRAVHDLLYRPQRAPEPELLGAILANLAAGLRAFADLAGQPPDGEAPPEGLALELRAIRELAEQVCGECVPREYAPELRVWMDRVHDLAERLAPAGTATHASS
jgi:hypothetical protein